MRKLPVRQESIEICNVFDINPYGLLSGGGLLIAAKDPEAMLAALEHEGINAAIVGSFTDSNDRVLINGDTKRFLEFPKTDEIYGLIN
jgi:hydrogenase maturation factor